MIRLLKYIPIATFLLAFSPFSLVAQNSGRLARIDSLKAIKTTSLESQYEVYLNLCYEYVDFNNQLAHQCSNRLFEFAVQLGDSSKMAASARLQGLFMKKLGDVDGSIEKYEFAFRVAVRNNLTEVLSLIYVSLPTPYIFKSEYQRALEILFESVDFFDKHNYPVRKSYALNNIGLVYFRMENYSKALGYFIQSLALRRSNQDTYDIPLLLNNIALCYSRLGEYRRAISFTIEALNTCKPACTSTDRVYSYLALGDAYLNLRNYELAEKFFQKAVTLARTAGNSDQEADALFGLGQVCLSNHEYARAEVYFLGVDSLSTKTRGTELATFKGLLNTYTVLDNSENLAIYQNKYIQLKNDIYTSSLMEKLIFLESSKRNDLNKSEAGRQRTVLKLTGQIIERRRIMIIALFLVGIMFVFFYVFIVED